MLQGTPVLAHVSSSVCTAWHDALCGRGLSTFHKLDPCPANKDNRAVVCHFLGGAWHKLLLREEAAMLHLSSPRCHCTAARVTVHARVLLYSLLAWITQACILHGRGGLAGATCSLGSSSGRWQQQGQTQGAGSLVCFYMPQEVLVCLGMTCDEVRLTMLQNCSI